MDFGSRLWQCSCSSLTDIEALAYPETVQRSSSSGTFDQDSSFIATVAQMTYLFPGGRTHLVAT